MASSSLVGQTIAIEGELKFSGIARLRKQVETKLSGLQGEVVIDFAAVTAVDSSALSFWLCCQRFAGPRAIKLVAINAPEELLGIAELVGLDGEIV